jgi:hypothetical protein
MHRMEETANRVRLTISVTPEVHSAFERLAKASGISLSRAMGEWLGDTLEAVEFTAEKVEQARAAPKIVMREMHAYALGLADETGALLKRVREREAPGVGKRSAALGASSPPSSNTGGKVPHSGAQKRRPTGGRR